MVAPLNNQGVTGASRVGGDTVPVNRSPVDGADFQATLEQALRAQELSAATTSSPAPALAETVFAEAFQSMERASAHIQNARAYFRGANPATRPAGEHSAGETALTARALDASA